MGKTILIVDDFESTLFVIQFTLESAGYKVLKAFNGEEALTYLDGSPIDMVISDFNMPIMNGYELTKAIRQMSEYKATPIIILSTDDSPEKKQMTQEMNIDAWLMKPFDREDFLKIISEII